MTYIARQSIVVAALTYKRPQMLAQLLQSLLTLEHPAGWEVRFLIVDNDADASAQRLVESFTARFGEDRLVYVVEPEPGIPTARNRALQEGVGLGATLLAFIDDDETPNPDWLTKLVGHRESTGAVLIGGPTRLSFSYTGLRSLWQRLVAGSLAARCAFLEAYSEKRNRQGHVMMIATGNWLGDLDWIAAHGVKFDPTLRDSGGSDTAFFRTVQCLGGHVSWCSDAIVYEHAPAKVISLRYQFNRVRSQSVVLAAQEQERPARMIARQSVRMAAGVGLVFIPLYGAASLTLGVHLIAAALGRFESLRGAQSRLYARPTTKA